jgi:unsaturated chondroitin disaccharide hydrolase
MIDYQLAAAVDQLSRAVGGLPDRSRYPRRLPVGADGWETVGAGDWTSGFFPGLLWMAYKFTGDPNWRDRAAEWTAGLEEERHTRSHHDLGFQFFNSYGRGLALTGDPRYREVLLDAAESLASRYDPRIGAIKSWDFSDEWHYPVIIDNMMNLELLYWAARETGRTAYRDMANSHGHVTADVHVRPDGGTYHVVDFDTTSGGVRMRVTHQGHADESTWARGQAWGIYGFTMAYRESGEERFLETAMQLADYYLDRAPADLVPVWDFDLAGVEGEPRDVSAAAITFSALIELADLTSGTASRRYRRAAETLLTSLTAPPYRIAPGDPEPALLRHGVGHKPAGTEIDVSLIYGDYYFMEGLGRVR